MCIWYKLALGHLPEPVNVNDISEWNAKKSINSNWFVHQACSELAQLGIHNRVQPMYIDSCRPENMRICKNTYQVKAQLLDGTMRDTYLYRKQTTPAALGPDMVKIVSSEWLKFQSDMISTGPKFDGATVKQQKDRRITTLAELTIRTAIFSLSRYEASKQPFKEFERKLSAVSGDVAQNLVNILGDAKVKLDDMHIALQNTRKIYETFVFNRVVIAIDTKEAKGNAKERAEANGVARAKQAVAEAEAAEKARVNLETFAESALGVSLVLGPCDSEIRLDYMRIERWDHATYVLMDQYLRQCKSSVEQTAGLDWKSRKQGDGSTLIFEDMILLDHCLQMCYRSIAYLHAHKFPDGSTHSTPHANSLAWSNDFLGMILSTIRDFFKKFLGVLKAENMQANNDYKAASSHFITFFERIAKQGLGAPRNPISIVNHGSDFPSPVPSTSRPKQGRQPAQSSQSSQPAQSTSTNSRSHHDVMGFGNILKNN